MEVVTRRKGDLLSDPYQMLLPLLIEIEYSAEKQSNSSPDVIEGVRKNQPDLEQWTDEEVVHLHHVLLEQSMIQALNPRSSADTRIDVLEWVDQITPFKKKSPAFSFDACCKLSGYDPEELRDTLHGEMKYRGIHPHSNPKIRT